MGALGAPCVLDVEYLAKYEGNMAKTRFEESCMAQLSVLVPV
jgi:hypothetical protein